MERYPRIKHVHPEFVSKMLDRWPVPRNAPFDRYGSRWTLGWLLRQEPDHLRTLCEKHALKDSGSMEELIRRLYLHDRSGRMRLGDPRIGYGPHHEAVKTPTCVCGKQLKKDLEAAMAKKGNGRRKKEMEGIKRLRFPRLKRHPRD